MIALCIVMGMAIFSIDGAGHFQNSTCTFGKVWFWKMINSKIRVRY